MKAVHALDFNDRVSIDGDLSLIGCVTSFQFRASGYISVEVSYVHNGDSKAAWIEDWRLTKVE